VWDNLNSVDIDALAEGADISIYERGWQPHKADGLAAARVELQPS
jgi:hypothetical protein